MTASLSRRRFLTGAGVTALGLTVPGFLAACGDGGGGAGDGTGKIELWIDIQGEPNQKYFTDNVVGGFKKAKPEIELTATFYKGEDLRRVVQTALQARSGPDVVRARRPPRRWPGPRPTCWPT